MVHVANMAKTTDVGYTKREIGYPKCKCHMPHLLTLHIYKVEMNLGSNDRTLFGVQTPVSTEARGILLIKVHLD